MISAISPLDLYDQTFRPDGEGTRLSTPWWVRTVSFLLVAGGVVAVAIGWMFRGAPSDDPRTADLVEAFAVAGELVETSLGVPSPKLTSYRTHENGYTWTFAGRCGVESPVDYSVTVSLDETGTWFCQDLRVGDREIIDVHSAREVAASSSPRWIDRKVVPATAIGVAGSASIAVGLTIWGLARFLLEQSQRVPQWKLAAAREAVAEGHLQRARCYLSKIIEQHPRSLISLEAKRLLHWI